MTTLLIDTNDKEKIQEFLAIGINNFNLKTKIQETQNEGKTSLSSSLNEQIKNAKSINTQKAKEFKSALEGLNNLMDSEKSHLTTNQARENYFSSEHK